jgi:uncharacterized iron-regulated protein
MVLILLLIAGTLQAAAVPPPSSSQTATTSSYTPNRVFDTSAGRFADFEVMLAAIATADVVFVGEQHDDPNTHRLEAAILEGLLRRKITPVVSLEMFERDVQSVLDGYLNGRTPEEEFLKNSRPWPRYATDYRALVESAKQLQLTVVAANVPRRIAAQVSKTGKDALAQLSEADRAFVARDLECPQDEYFKRFVATMGDHPAGTQTADDRQKMVERFYWAQCVKDETMAESIAQILEKRTGIIHFNGAFHSDFRLGTADRVKRRAPAKRVVVISILPVTDLDSLSPAGEDLKRADYLVYTLSTPKPQLPTPREF